MHIEPGIVDGARMALGYGTAAAAFAGTAKLAIDFTREMGIGSLVAKSMLAAASVFVSFEILFHYPVGVSEVHLILGTSLLLLFGAAPSAIGLATGLLVQGVFFAPTDLPQYGMNVTTLLVPLFATRLLAKRIIEKGQAYVDLRYSQVLKLSAMYQGGIVSWVAFWAFYGQGINAASFASMTQFGGAYLLVIVVEPLADLGLLALAKKSSDNRAVQTLLNPQLYRP